MKRVVLFTCLSFLSFNISLFAQGNETDAFTLSNADLSGTARSMSMGGAFGALGGDISVISNNPAGLGIYRSSEVSGSFDLSMIRTSTDWTSTKIDRNKTNFSPNSFGVELFFPTSGGSIRNWNLGFSYNRAKNFNRRYKMESSAQPHSLASYAAIRASNAFLENDGQYAGIAENAIGYDNGYNPYYNSNLAGNWLPVLGYNSGMIGNMGDDPDGVYKNAFGSNRDWYVKPKFSMLNVIESGYMDEFNVGFGMNISNFMFVGTSISVTNLNYKYASGYEELLAGENSNRDDHLYLSNWLTTEGTAVSANIGAIMNLQAIRIGVAYNSPRWYDMTDYFHANAGTSISSYSEPEMEDSTPNNEFSEYEFRTPGKWIFSGALILGQHALISTDYEIMNYSSMRYFGRDNYDERYEYNTNYDIRDDYTWSHTLRLGAEIKVNPQFAVRGGYVMQTSPMRQVLSNNEVEVLPSGTIPHFTVTAKPVNTYTVGFGYRFTPNFFMDLACVYRSQRSKAYAFSYTYYNEPSAGILPVPSVPAKLDTKSTRVILTMGYKF